MKPRILSSGVIIVRQYDDEPRYLLLRCYNYWDFPKGVVEAGEEPLQAAIREVEEETTLVDLSFRWGHDFMETPPYKRKKVARYYVAESRHGDVSLPVNPELGHPEHDEFRWLPYSAGHELVNIRLKPILTWAHNISQKS